MLKELTKQASGLAGNNIAQGTAVATIATPGTGRWEIWGHCRHTLVDGLRLKVGSTLLVNQLACAANASVNFGPVIADITNKTDNIIVELATATGAADTASATVYAKRVSSL